MLAIEQQCDTAAHWNARSYEALFDKEAPRRIALVAVNERDENATVAFLIARCDPQEWEIENVVVAPQHRNRGVASGLIRELLERAEGITSVLLEVRESNIAARRLYAKMGFSEQGLRRNYYRDPVEDALLLRTMLQSGDKTS